MLIKSPLLSSLLSFSFIGDLIGYRPVTKLVLGSFVSPLYSVPFPFSLDMLDRSSCHARFWGRGPHDVNTALIRLIYPSRYLGRGMGINSFIVAVSAAARAKCRGCYSIFCLLAVVILSQCSYRYYCFNVSDQVFTTKPTEIRRPTF